MDTRKTVGATTLSATGGSVVGGALAAIVLYFFPESAQVELLAPLTIVLSAVCALAGGYLSPSKAETLAPYLAQASEYIAEKVAVKAPTAVVPSADEVAEAVANRTSTEGYTGAHAATSDVEQYRPAEAPKATEPGVDVQAVAAPADTSDDAYPDLDSLAKQ
jgi:hypothetical protein